MSGFAGRQGRISLQGEVSNHKEISDEVNYLQVRLRRRGRRIFARSEATSLLSALRKNFPQIAI
jgi:hypothetical protein